jgi:hypothetical protein
MTNPLELRDSSLGKMLAARYRFNIMKEIATISLESISPHDFAARFLAVVARPVPDEARAIRDVYEAAAPTDADIFRELPKDRLDTLVGAYLAEEAEAMEVRSGTADPRPSEQESERLLRLIKTGMEELKTTVEDTAQETARAVYKSSEARLATYPVLNDKIIMLARHGWFISQYFGLRETDQLAKAAASPDIEELEKCIAKLYDTNFNTHLNVLIQHHPDREFVLRPAGNAHHRKEYALSVMAFFSQIDGICFEIMKKHLFIGSDDVPSYVTNKLHSIIRREDDHPLKQLLGFFHEIMWRSLSEKLPMSYTIKQRVDSKYDGLNRHTVLHGIATKDYATKENSLKAFSLLSFMASLPKSADSSDPT